MRLKEPPGFSHGVDVKAAAVEVLGLDDRVVLATVVVPWLHWPTLTQKGNLSHAKRAGKKMPWLSANNVNNLQPRYLHQAVRKAWRDHVEEVASSGVRRVTQRVRVRVELHRNPANVMDVGGQLEGLKPLVDGLVLAGVVGGDSPGYVAGYDASPVARCARGADHVVLLLESA